MLLSMLSREVSCRGRLLSFNKQKSGDLASTLFSLAHILPEQCHVALSTHEVNVPCCMSHANLKGWQVVCVDIHLRSNGNLIFQDALECCYIWFLVPLDYFPAAGHARPKSPPHTRTLPV